MAATQQGPRGGTPGELFNGNAGKKWSKGWPDSASLVTLCKKREEKKPEGEKIRRGSAGSTSGCRKSERGTKKRFQEDHGKGEGPGHGGENPLGESPWVAQPRQNKDPEQTPLRKMGKRRSWSRKP